MKAVFSLILTALCVAGCTDLSAVTKFSQTAPDVATLDSLTNVYVSDPQTQSDWQSLWGTPDPALAPQIAVRAQQKEALDALHGLIVDYMKALGDISGSGSADISTEAKAVSSKLASLQKVGAVDLNAAQISSIGDLITIVPQTFLNLYRAQQVGEIIRKNQQPFHAMISTEIEIVNQAYIPDFQNTEGVIGLARGRSDSTFGSAPGGVVPSASRFTLDRQAEAASSRLGDAVSSAGKYVTALQNLTAAYDQLVQSGGNFSGQTLQQIEPYLNDAQKAYQDMTKL